MTIVNNKTWFACYPTKWLGAIAAMQPMEALIYMVVCFRIYEVDGPCPDDVEALARRTGLDNRVVTKSLARLFKSKKLIECDGGIMNPFAEKILAERREHCVGNGKRYKKNELNQRNVDAHLHKQETLNLDSENQTGSESDSRSLRSRCASDWPTDYREQFWAKYPRKIAKAAAIRALDRVKKSGSVSWAAIDEALDKFAAWAKGREIRFVKHPATWINGGCWDDQLTQAEFTDGQDRRGGGFLDNAVAFAEARRNGADRSHR